MGYASARAVIESHLAENWTATPVAWENVMLDPQNPGDGFPSGEAFIALGVQWGSERQIGYGAETTAPYRNVGALVIHVRTPKGEGTAEAHALADQVAALFRGKQMGGFTFWSAAPEPGEIEPAWYRLTVNIPFKLDEFY